MPSVTCSSISSQLALLVCINGHPRGGGGGGGKIRRSPPPLKNQEFYFSLYWKLFCHVFLLIGGLFHDVTSLFHDVTSLFHHLGVFLLLFPHVGAFFWLDSPTKISAGAHVCIPLRTFPGGWCGVITLAVMMEAPQGSGQNQ